MFECDLAHCRSVAVICMLHKIRCHPTHPLYGALPVPVRVTCSAVIALTYAPDCCRTTCCTALLLFPCQYLCGTILVTPYAIYLELASPHQEQGQCLFICLAAHCLFVSRYFLFLLFPSMGWYFGAGVFRLIGC